jgi:hypothetical protein
MIAQRPPKLMERIEARAATYPEWLQGLLAYLAILLLIMSPVYPAALILFILWLQIVVK